MTFKSLSDATTTTDATASAANKTSIFNHFPESLALQNDCYHRAGGCFPSVFQTTYGNNIYFVSGSGITKRFKDPAQSNLKLTLPFNLYIKSILLGSTIVFHGPNFEICFVPNNPWKMSCQKFCRVWPVK